MDNFVKEIDIIKEELGKIIKGKENVLEKVLMAILAQGHVLLEDVPGVGKTTMAKAFSKVLSLQDKRIQFTPDVLPSDITGFSIYRKETENFIYKEGAAFCNLLLADEINRTSPKTQSALLEIMEEGKVTVDGICHELPKPYVVIATQNPMGSIGTQALPESQLDRFMIKLSVGYPDKESELEILKGKEEVSGISSAESAITKEELLLLQESVKKVHIEETVYQYILDLVAKTRNHPYIKLGISTRGAVAIAAMTKACAFVKGRNYVLPEDVQEIFIDTASHRILLNGKAKLHGGDEKALLLEIIKDLGVAGI